MKIEILLILIIGLITSAGLNIGYAQQMDKQEYIISVDVGHDQIFWGDPSNTEKLPDNRADRVRYLASKLQGNASSLNAELDFLDSEINASALRGSDLLFIHVPSSQYSRNEVSAIQDFLNTGGSLFLVMEVDYWASLSQSNVNDIIRPFGIQFGSDSPDAQVGGRTREDLITSEALKIPYHGGRVVNGGTPFSFSVGPKPVSYGTFTELDSGGKIIVMGDGMASLYMNSWQDVDDYQTEKFMQDVLQWLLE